MTRVSLLDQWGHEEPSDLAAALRERADPAIDLVGANPHEHGIAIPHEVQAAWLAEGLAKAQVYRPDPLGQRCAREAVAAWYAARHVPVDPAHIVLTPGTSLAYLYTFRLLGGEMLVPMPAYPLFADIALVAGVATRSYHLAAGPSRWSLDIGEIAFQLTPRTRAIVLVSPHNPTGHVASRAELAALAELCRARSLALIVDEVFSEFLVAAAECPRPAEAAFGFPLVLTLQGISKMLALPGWKAGWIAVSGEGPRVARMASALAMMSDTFLPVSEPVQGALPRVLAEGTPHTARFAALLRDRAHVLHGALGTGSLPEGGVYRLLPHGAPSAGSEALRLVRECGVHVHPGPLYGLGEDRLVATHVAAEDVLREGVRRLRG